MTISIPPPELSVNPEEMLRRAQAMRPRLRELQESCEQAGRLSDEINNEFIKAGFYRILQPLCFGGYEFDLPGFVKVMIEISRGCSESGWVLALTAGHAAVMALFPEAAQREVFGEAGEFRMPGVAMPAGIAVEVPGGYRVRGAWDYGSGCDLATHFFGSVLIQHGETKAPLGSAWVVFDRNQYRIIDNWNVIGMQGTGSRRVHVDEVFLPTHRVLPVFDARGQPVPRLAGGGLHRNPMYHGKITPLLISEVGAVSVGAARGALDIYEEILHNKKTSFPPFQPRADAVEFQRYFGQALSLVDTAEAALLKTAADYMDHTRREADEGIPYTDEAERRMLMVEQHCVRLAWEAVELMFRTAGTSAAGRGAMLGRYFRNLAVVRTHITLQLDHTAANSARLHFGTEPLSRL
jgi:3-hydroxy-9,10-secoandrosta-1,3,5(10)-triene-9,17-dione monooxygenase